MSLSTAITNDALKAALDAAQAQVSAARRDRDSAEERLRLAEREVTLLTELAKLRGVKPAADGDAKSPAEDVVAARTGAGSDAVEAAVAVLREHGEPLAIRPLMRAVVDRGARIPGRGEQANLISALTRAPEITRPQRGIYALAEWQAAAVEKLEAAARSEAAARPRAARRRKAKA